jgi:thioredoxin reductase (NADPH)
VDSTNNTQTQSDIRDLVVIGAGPSALSAAIYTTREDIDTVIYEKAVIGGLAATTDHIDNYPGFPEGVDGLKLSELLQQQAERFGAKMAFGEVMELEDRGDYKLLKTDSGDVKAKAVLIATGSDYKKIGVPGEMEYYGRGVHYCATCDGAFYRGKKLIVVGGGNSAVQETIFLTRFASHIDMLVRSTITASDVLVEDLQRFIDDGKVTVHLGMKTLEIAGENNSVTKVIGEAGGEKIDFLTDGVFVFVGLKPNTEFLRSNGFIHTNVELETSIPGVYASGDVRHGATAQIASAVGEGATAALHIREYLHSLTRPKNPVARDERQSLTISA